jgi:hypothetical protein
MVLWLPKFATVCSTKSLFGIGEDGAMFGIERLVTLGCLQSNS